MRLLLNKKHKNIDDTAYRAHLSDQIIYNTRLVFALSIILFLSFSIVDIWAYTDAQDSILFTRITVSIIFVSILLLTFKKDFTEKLYAFVIPVPYVVATTAINYMIYLASPGDYASQVYFSGLMLIIVAMFAWSFLKVSSNLSILIYLLFGYSYAKFSGSSSNGSMLISELLIDYSFLIGSAVIGFITQHLRDKQLRENFALHQLLLLDNKEKEKEAQNNKYLADHDALTRLPNRRYMMELLEESLNFSKEYRKILLILFIDLNKFKEVNDTYGHSVGDEVLMIATNRLRLSMRKGDHLCRLGGDEYLMSLVVDNITKRSFEEIRNKYIEIISQPMIIQGFKVKVGASIGFASYPMQGDDLENLIEIADQAMYENKKKQQLDKAERNNKVIQIKKNR